MDEKLKRTAMEAYGYTAEQVESLSEKQQTIIKSGPARRAYKVIMEVVSAKNCGLKPKIGDRYVTNGSGVLNPGECTFPICLWALAPMLPLSYVIFDRLSHGQDPNGHLLENVRCTDTGVGCGGIGEALFRIRCEKV